MNYRIKVSEEANSIAIDVKNKYNLLPNVLYRYAISIAINDHSFSSSKKYPSDGVELNRNVLFGDYEEIIRLLIVDRENRSFDDEEFFPDLTKSYIEHGIRVIGSIARLTKGQDTFFRALLGEVEGGGIV